MALFLRIFILSFDVSLSLVTLMKALFTFLLFIFICLTVNAQKISSFKNFTINNPLSYLSIRTIVQDQYGFMWFGSQEGLHRFDGYQFTSFQHDIDTPSSISSNVISRILFDSKNIMWIATRGGGVNIYNDTTKNFQHITTTTSLKLTDNDVNTLTEDSLGNIWIGTEKGVSLIIRKKNYQDKSKWQVKHITQQLGNSKSLANNSVETILQVNQNIWLGTNGGGISVYDLQGNFIRQIQLYKNNKNNDEAKLIKVLFQDKQKNIWVGTTESGLFKISADEGEIKNYLFNKNEKLETNSHYLTSNSIETIYQDSHERIWIGSDKGLMILNSIEDSFDLINHSAINQQSLSNDFVLTVFEDKDSMIWIGTFSGVSRWEARMTIFNQFSDKDYPQISSSLTMSFEQLNNKQIIFATYAKGLYILNLETNKVSPFKYDVLPKNIRLTTLLIDKNNLWVGSRFSGLFRINLLNGKLFKYKHSEKNLASISANSITDIIKDQQGNIWISTFHKGINKLNNDDSFTRFEQTTPLSNKGPSTDHILQLLADKQGYLWLATYGGGINRLTPETGEFIHLKHHENDSDSLSNDVAWIMLQDKKNNLWVGTQAAGINILSYENLKKNNFSFQHIDIKNGMKDQTVYAFSQDKVGNIWFSTNRGISRYSPSTKKFKYIDNRHGLTDLEYNHGAVLKEHNGVIYFGNANGFTSVDPQAIINEQPAPKVRLTNIFKLNEIMNFKHNLNELKTLTFDYNDQLISFEYVGLNYSDPESIRYKYRLLGFDKQWVNAGKLRRATYTNLPAGKYQLEVIAGNNDNVWSDPSLSLNIVVKPAPWFTWWAYLLYTILLALFLLAYSRFLNRKLVIEQQQKYFLKQQIQEKTQEFKQKNIELQHVNKQLENAATTDKLTGIKSRRYLDIYIEQASQLMTQIHQNLLPVQRHLLPRLYIVMVRINNFEQVNDSDIIDIKDLILYSRNSDDMMIRWSDDTFAIIGYEKEDNARELCLRLNKRFQSTFKQSINMVYCFYPFNREQPMELSWDQVSVITEHGLNVIINSAPKTWLGLYEPKIQPFDYLNFLKTHNIEELNTLVKIKQS